MYLFNVYVCIYIVLLLFQCVVAIKDSVHEPDSPAKHSFQFKFKMCLYVLVDFQ